MDLLMTLVASYRESSAVQSTVGGDELAARVASWMAMHYSEKVTVAQLCGLFDINRTALSERFRAATGSSLIDYLSRVRIDMACRLLRETKLPAGEVLFRVGFNDAAHFSRTFRKIMNMTPAAYRAAYSKK
jgi:AraC family L-rhamnose operon regulatory protein RhaS